MRKLDKSMVSGLAALSLAVVMLNHLIFKDAILEWNPSPLWLIVILIPLRYGSPAGIIAGVTAAVIYLTELVALGHNFQELMHMNPAMLLIPTLFIFVGIYTGETREHLGQRSEFFKNEVDRLNAVLDSNETIRMNLERTNLEFQKRIAGQTNTLLGVHADLNRLSSATSEEELWQLLTDIVQRETKAESCVVWEIGKSVIVAVTGAALESVPPLAHLAARKRRLTTLIDWVENYGDAEKPGAEIAVILSDDPDKKLVLTASGVGFGNLNRAAIVFFDMAAQWAGATAAEFRRLDSLLKTSVDDSNLGLFSEAYVRNRIREQAMLARRHKTELAILACIMDGEYPEEMRGKLAVIVSCAIRTSVRGSDGVAYFEGQKAFVTVLPGSDEEGALIVARKIAAHLDALALVDNEGRLLPNMRWRPLRVTGEEKEEEIYQRLFNRQDRTEETAA